MSELQKNEKACKDYREGICNLFCKGTSNECSHKDTVFQYARMENRLETMAELAEEVLHNQGDFYKIIDSMKLVSQILNSMRRSAAIRNKAGATRITNY
jgi:hypothetical protein